MVDVNNNPDNPVINVRAFGETPFIVGKLAAAFIGGAAQHPVLTIAKHFPRRGDRAVDSHLELPVLPHSPARLARVELPPFVEAIAARADAVMSTHLLIPAWDAEFPATVSRKILIRKLRQELGFEGLIVTDALVMGAIANKYGPNEDAVLAAQAGADVLLMPLDPEGAILAVCEAVTQGRLSLPQINEFVKRIGKAKIKVGLPISDPPQPAQASGGSKNLQSLESIDLSLLANPQARSTAADIWRDSLKFGGSLPLMAKKPPENQLLRNLIVVDDVLG